MKRACLLVGLVVGAAVQAPAQGSDTSLFTPSRELRVGVSSISLKRAVSFPGQSVSYGNMNLRGLEVMTMGAHGGGVRVRFETGSVSGSPSFAAGGKMENLVGHLILGGHEFALIAGYRLSSVTWNGERTFHMPEIGFEGGRHFAGAGILVKGSASYRMMLTEAKLDSVKSSGFEGRTSVLYVPPRMPIYLEVGYRREVLAFQNPAEAIVRRDEGSAVVITVGLQSGLSVR